MTTKRVKDLTALEVALLAMEKAYREFMAVIKREGQPNG